MSTTRFVTGRIGRCVGFAMVILAAVTTTYGATQVQKVVGIYGGNGFFSMQATESNAYGESRMRHDTEINHWLSGSTEHRTEIERVDLDKRWEIDPKRERYSEESISAAQEKSRKEIEKSKNEWEKNRRKIGEKDNDTVVIRNAETKTTGPGPTEIVNGFSCRSYTVVTTIQYESLPDHQSVGTRILFQKMWVSDSPILAQYNQDERAYWKALGLAGGNDVQLQSLYAVIKDDMNKAEKDSTPNPWFTNTEAISKVKGNAVRTIGGIALSPEETALFKKQEAATVQSKDESIIQPSDLSSGVSGVISGIAGRWVSKKVEAKIDDKMQEHPAWVDEAGKDLNGERIGSAWFTEIKSVAPIDSPTLFDLPIGYKKVSSL